LKLDNNLYLFNVLIYHISYKSKYSKIEKGDIQIFVLSVLEMSGYEMNLFV